MPRFVSSTLHEHTVARAVLFLGITALVCVGAIVYLSAISKLRAEALPVLSTLGGACVGSLGTLLVSFTPAPVAGGRRATDPPPEPGPTSERMDP